MNTRGPYGADSSPAAQREALRSGELPVAVYGLGKMGLPLAGVYAERTGNVVGVDVDPAVVAAVERGECHVTGEPGLPELVAEQVEAGRLRATTDGPAAATTAAIHVVIVPTLVADGEPELSILESVTADVAAGLSAGDLVVVESTVPPGTCRELLAPTLAEASGVDAFGLAFCPERTSSGRALRDVRGAYPKVVGGVDGESARAAALVYDALTDGEVHVVSDATTAEAVKVFEGVYRDVNIALANEFATLADGLGISVREAIETANRIPYCDLHDPGPGVGGHCIPFYPYFLLAVAGSELPVTRTARELNESMPAWTVSWLAERLGRELEGADVLVLGLTYRAGVEETRASPGPEIVEMLAQRGATVFACDPLVDPADHGARPVAVDAVADGEFDAVVLVTPHEAFEGIDWGSMAPTLVLDGRDALEIEDGDHRHVTLGGSVGGRPQVVDRGEATPPRTD